MKNTCSILFFIGFLLCNIFYCNSQNNNQSNDKFLIILDMQEDYISANIPDSAVISQIDAINYLIENTDPKKVIYVVSLGKAISISSKGTKIDTLIGSEIDKRIKKVNNNVFEKTKGDAFKTEAVNGYLQIYETRKIIVVGLMAEKCVFKTLLGGKKKGYEMYTVPDAVVGKTKESKEKAMQKLAEKGIKLLKTEEIK